MVRLRLLTRYCPDSLTGVSLTERLETSRLVGGEGGVKSNTQLVLRLLVVEFPALSLMSVPLTVRRYSPSLPWKEFNPPIV